MAGTGSKPTDPAAKPVGAQRSGSQALSWALEPDSAASGAFARRFQVSQYFATFKSVKNGVPAASIRDAYRQGLSRADVHMIIPSRTLDRRIAEGLTLRMDEADGIARLLRVLSHARRVFGDDALADEWLRSANPALEGQVPMQMARTDLGGREVEAVLGRMEYGVFG